MSLTAALRSAQASLTTNAAQTAITSRNIANAAEPHYSRKIASVVTAANGSAGYVSVTRATDAALSSQVLSATSAAAAAQAQLSGLTQLEATIGDPELYQSPAALVGALTTALETWSTSPGDLALAQGAVDSARRLADALNEATAAVQQVRAGADRSIAAGVDTLNALLAEFETVNTAVVEGTRTGADITDSLDDRDRLLAQISEQVGINVVAGADNDMLIYTDSGVTLFESVPRAVVFQPTTTFTAGTTGGAVYIDGVPVTGSSATMPIGGGALAGLTALRDETAVAYQSQLDEIARGLIVAFAESDQSATPTLPDVPGLFTWSGNPAMPGPGLVAGLAGEIAISANADPDRGGDPMRIRDGGVSDPLNPAYLYNDTGAAGFSDRLFGLLDSLAAGQPFDPAAGLASSVGLADFAEASVGWLEASRQTADDAASYQTALFQRTSEALSNATGVNLDDELALLLNLERSYQAAAKLIAAIDGMFAALLEAV